MVQETSLRQGETKVKVQGLLSEKTLEAVVINGREAIRGAVTIEINETSFVTFNVFVNKYTYDRVTGAVVKTNKIYPGIETVMNTYKSIAEHGREEATRVRITNGEIKPETFFNERGQNDIIKYKSNFFNSVKDGEDFEPRAEFDAEVFIKNFREEFRNETETGRLIVDAYLPTYDGIAPISFVVPEELADVFKDTYERGSSAKLSGDIVNTKIVEVKEIPRAFGKPDIETKTTYRNELVITGGSLPYDEDSASKPFPEAAVRQAVVDRELKLEEEKRKFEDKLKNPNPAANTQAKPANPFSAPQGGTGRTLPNLW